MKEMNWRTRCRWEYNIKIDYKTNSVHVFGLDRCAGRLF
jgi:hypothetical protein